MLVVSETLSYIKMALTTFEACILRRVRSACDLRDKQAGGGAPQVLPLQAPPYHHPHRVSALGAQAQVHLQEVTPARKACFSEKRLL